MIHSELLEVLRCPETRQKLALADAALIGALNEQIGAGRLRNRGGTVVTEKLDAGFIREDGRFLYPVCADLPIMLMDEAIPLKP